jgi:hypothetical protein
VPRRRGLYSACFTCQTEIRVKITAGRVCKNWIVIQNCRPVKACPVRKPICLFASRKWLRPVNVLLCTKTATADTLNRRLCKTKKERVRVSHSGLSHVSDHAPPRRHAGPIASNMEYSSGMCVKGSLVCSVGWKGKTKSGKGRDWH